MLSSIPTRFRRKETLLLSLGTRCITLPINSLNKVGLCRHSTETLLMITPRHLSLPRRLRTSDLHQRRVTSTRHLNT